LDVRWKAALQGLVSLTILALLYVENVYSFPLLGGVLRRWPLAIAVLFSHNAFTVSAIMLCMSFYTNLKALMLFKGDKYGGAALRHPGAFSAAFAVVIIFTSLFRGASLANAQLQDAPTILLVSLPVMVMEGYGLYLAVKSVLTKNVKAKTLLHVYTVFFTAAIVEASLIALTLR